MNLNDRLQARALLADELYLRATKAEYERDQARAEVVDLKEQLAKHDAPDPEDAAPGS